MKTPNMLKKTDALSQKDRETIRKIINSFLLKTGVPFAVIPYSQDFHNLCLVKAKKMGLLSGPENLEHPLIPFLQTGVALASMGYNHIPEDSTRVFIALYTTLLVYIDDTYAHNIDGIETFIERFVRREAQAEPLLDGLASILQEIPNHYEPLSANIILASSLNFINALTLDFRTKRMKASLHAKGYPDFTRRMSGAAEAFTIMGFPARIPVSSYIQCVPEVGDFLNYGNDVLSFYKEQLAGDNLNYISVRARCQDIPKMTAFKRLADETAALDLQVCKILEGNQEAYDTWKTFKDGYIRFHISFGRYRLADLMK